MTGKEPETLSRFRVFCLNEEYSAYLNSDAWKAKRLKRLAISQFRCSACSENKAVHVHHLTYARIFNEDMADLMPLCELHHMAAEEMIRKGELRRTGDVLFLATETLRLIIGRPLPRNSSKVKRARAARNSIQDIFVANPKFLELLRLDRKQFKRAIKKFVRQLGQTGFSRGRLLSNAFTLYDLKFKRGLL